MDFFKVYVIMKKVCIIIEWKGIDLLMKKLILAIAGLGIILVMLCPVTAAASNKDSERFPVENEILDNLVFNVDFSTGTGNDLCGGILANNGITIEDDSLIETKVGVCGEYYNRYEIATGLIDAKPLTQFAYEAYIYLSSEQTPWSHIISSRNEMFDMTDYASWRGSYDDPALGIGIRLGNYFTCVPAETMYNYYDQWMHVVIQGMYGEVVIYINGEVATYGYYDIATSAAQSVAGINQDFGEIYIGGLDSNVLGTPGTDSGSVMDTVEGKIAYVRLYNTYLLESQIDILYHTAITPPSNEPVYGDVNGDGYINPLDGTMLNRYNAKWNAYILGSNLLETNCDLNNDGYINPLDGTILARHNASWATYISLPWGVNT